MVDKFNDVFYKIGCQSARFCKFFLSKVTIWSRFNVYLVSKGYGNHKCPKWKPLAHKGALLPTYPLPKCSNEAHFLPPKAAKFKKDKEFQCKL